ncbi:MAG: YihY family inner membrane protein [Rhodospirillales bacterium]|nr:YihY family inner membrane protein [Rhodospirillales bacterium]
MMPPPQMFAPFAVRRLWGPKANSVAGWRRTGIQALRIAYAVARDNTTGRLGLHAASLVYTSTLSLVPILALGFSVLKGFGIHYRFEPLLLQALSPLGGQASRVTDQIMEFVDKMDVGVLGVVGVAALFYTAISVVQKIETACNDIWHVGQARPMTRKFTDYLSVLLIGPVLLFSALGIVGSLIASPTVQQLSAIPPLGLLIDTLGRLVPFLLLLCAFTFIYKFLPNTRVPLSSAFVGGVVGTVLWTIAGIAFAEFAKGTSSYEAIYSALASLILFFLWLNVSWLVVLIGVDVSYYHAHPESLLGGADDPLINNLGRERVALAAVGAIAAAQYKRQPAMTPDAIADRIKASPQAVSQILETLRSGGLLTTSADDPPRWLSTRPFDALPVKEVVDVVRNYPKPAHVSSPPGGAAVDDIEARIEHALADALDSTTVRDLALDQTDKDADAQIRRRSIAARATPASIGAAAENP